MSKSGEKMQNEILAILLGASGALSAYDLLRELRATHPNIAPPTVYRALAVLTRKGRVYRVESLKAYIARQTDGAHRTPVVSICDDCGTIEEWLTPDVFKTLSRFVDATGFTPQRHVIELHGICADCGNRQAST